MVESKGCFISKFLTVYTIIPTTDIQSILFSFLSMQIWNDRLYWTQPALCGKFGITIISCTEFYFLVSSLRCSVGSCYLVIILPVGRCRHTRDGSRNKSIKLHLTGCNIGVIINNFYCDHNEYYLIYVEMLNTAMNY